MRTTALITGASKRIGKALSEHLAAKGWNVLVHYNESENPAKELVELLKYRFPEQEFSLIKADLSHENEVASLIPRAIHGTGIFQLLINNASAFNPGYLAETGIELYNRQMNVNLKAPFMLMHDFARLCRNGNIINFVDTRITSNKSNFAAYSLSKKGLWELTKMAALEFAPEIRVNAIAPGVTLAPEDKDENYLNNLARAIPMKRPGGLAPVFKALDFILENPHLTGQLIFADGGENLGQNM